MENCSTCIGSGLMHGDRRDVCLSCHGSGRTHTRSFAVIDTSLPRRDPQRFVTSLSTRKLAMAYARLTNGLTGSIYGVQSPNGRIVIPIGVSHAH